MDIESVFTNKDIELIALMVQDPLTRTMQNKVEDKFAEEFLSGGFREGDCVEVGTEGKELRFRRV